VTNEYQFEFHQVIHNVLSSVHNKVSQRFLTNFKSCQQISIKVDTLHYIAINVYKSGVKIIHFT